MCSASGVVADAWVEPPRRLASLVSVRSRTNSILPVIAPKWSSNMLKTLMTPTQCFIMLNLKFRSSSIVRDVIIYNMNV